MVKRAVFSVVLVAALSLLCNGLSAQKKQVEWRDANDADSLFSLEPRPIIIDVYTNWCYYCKVMDATTWRNDSVVQYLQENYYPIKLNAEDRKPIRWQGKIYPYDTRYKVHRLAYFLLSGRMSFPSTIIIPVNGEPIIIPGAFKPREGEMTLKYFGERLNESINFRQFQKTFSSKW